MQLAERQDCSKACIGYHHKAHRCNGSEATYATLDCGGPPAAALVTMQLDWMAAVRRQSTPSTAARDHQYSDFKKLAAPTPTADIIMRPGYWNRTPPSRPPGMPFLMAPRAKETCVDVGPGRQELSEKSSRNTDSLIHLFL